MSSRTLFQRCLIIQLSTRTNSVERQSEVSVCRHFEMGCGELLEQREGKSRGQEKTGK